MASGSSLYYLMLVMVGIAWSQKMGSNVEYRPDQCLSGGKHREPKPETGDYHACHQWKDGACCTPEFTKKLVNSSVISIDGFHWDRCDSNFSSQCRRFFVEIECFYRCSPNIAHFEYSEQLSALANLPVCGDYCDRWYEACKDEETCAVNWITDWNYTTTGENLCKANSTCQRYSDVYKNGRGICNMLWGQSFFYSNSTSTDPDDTRECLIPYFPVNSTNPNLAVINKFFRNVNPSPTPNGSTSAMGSLSLALVVFLALFLVIYL